MVCILVLELSLGTVAQSDKLLLHNQPNGESRKSIFPIFRALPHQKS